MSMPGFTATNSLTPTTGAYYGGASLAVGEDGSISPQFLGPIVEAFESVKDALSSAVQSAAASLGNMISNFQSSGGGDGQPFVCGQWVTSVAACNGSSPAYSEAEMMGRCASTNPAWMAACAAASAALYPLVQQACSDGSPMGDMVGQVCHGT